MNETKREILNVIEKYLEENDCIRFSQALFNLGINEFASPDKPELNGHLLRDIYNDSDKRVLERMKSVDK